MKRTKTTRGLLVDLRDHLVKASVLTQSGRDAFYENEMV
jgi:hypothetical protein